MNRPTDQPTFIDLLSTDEPLTFVRHLGDDDVFHRGPDQGGVAILAPGLWANMPAGLLAAMRARRACAAGYRCPLCGADRAVTPGSRPGLLRDLFAHEPACPVTDEHLARALAAWERQVGRYARGRRLQEIPGVAA